MIRNSLLLVIFLFQTKKNLSQEITYLYNDTGQNRPYLQYFPAKEKAKYAVLICPGGGYGHVSLDHEGKQAAEWLNNIGLDAYVLNYRVNRLNEPHHYPEPLDDVKAAWKLLEQRSYRQAGILGFSAGGHLAGLFITEDSTPADFAILVYPVITSKKKYQHRGSFRNLLGKNYHTENLDHYSIEQRVTVRTPPVWLMHCKDDEIVPWQNSQLMYERVHALQPQTQLALFEKGGHGFGMRNVGEKTDSWRSVCDSWLKLTILD
jgi:acetyl esterase/lipase